MEISLLPEYGGVKDNKEDTTVKQTKERPGVMVYFHLFDMLKLMDTRQVGEMMLALMAYAKEGVEPDFTEQVMRVVWVSMKNAADLDQERYAERCKRAKAAIEKRWNKEDTDEYERIPPYTKNTNHNTNTETDTPTETITKADADAITQASASANTETEKETSGAVSPRRELPPLEIPPSMANSPSYRRMADASKLRLTPEEHEQRRQAYIHALQHMPD